MRLFGQKKRSKQIKDYLKKGAVILDVRTQEEWDEGHIEGAKHIILNSIPSRIDEIKELNKPIITVCRSGTRSEQAIQVLSENDIDAINGGPWQNVAQYI